MDHSNLIPILLLLPILGAIVTLLASPRSNPRAAGPLAFICSLVPLAVVIYMVANFPNLRSGTTDKWYYNFDYNWIANFGIHFTMGLDTIGLWLLVLTAVLTPISILASFNYIKERQPEFYAWMLMLHAGMLGVFCARDILVFYLFFEFTLIPMFFIIGIWGGQDRRRAAGKFFLFTFAGSVLTLVSLVYLAYVYANGYVDAGGRQLIAGSGVFSFQLADLQAIGSALPRHVQCLVFLGMMAGFAVKVPLFPVHTWLPLAHTEAPTAGSVILAGVLLKLGTYGMLRFALPILPLATLYFAPAIAIICVVGIIYGALVSWAQSDMKKLIAYSSVSHLAFCVLGMFALTKEGLTGSVLYMLNHGLSTGALFLVVGMIYERYHTRDMDQVGGIVRRMPALGFFAIFFVVSSVALPGLNGFVSEFLVLIGTFVSGQSRNGVAFGGNLGPAFAIPAATGMILAAVYLLYWAGRVVFGPLKEPAHEHAHGEEAAAGVHAVRDLSLREWLVLTPIAILIIYMGVYPQLVIDSLQPPLTTVATSINSFNTPRVADAPVLPALSSPGAPRLALTAGR
jgi:NADH-quinone oxidoreductase subunit M